MRSRKLIVVMSVLGLCLSLNAQNPNPNSQLDSEIQNQMTAEHLPGVSTIIVKNGKIIWVESYGYADVENAVPVEDTTVFMLASMSKLFTGTAAMQAVESGIVNLDTDINNYLPWSVSIPGFETVPVTMRRLMTHTGSINDGAAVDAYYDYPDPSISLSDCMQRYFSTSGADYNPGDNFLSGAPGTIYNYSNMGTALNAFVVESAAEIPFDAYCETSIFSPLCMENTAWHFADFDSARIARPYKYQNGSYVAYPHYGFADYPDGQLRSTVMDLGNFMLAYLNGGTFGENAILAESTISEMWTPQVAQLDATQGLNWYQEEIFHSNGSALLWGHNGGESGVSTDMYLDPVNEIGLCVLSNGEGDALYICDALYDYALNMNTGAGVIPSCIGSNSIPELSREKAKIIKILDLLGREVEYTSEKPMIIFYNNGRIEKVFPVQ